MTEPFSDGAIRALVVVLRSEPADGLEITAANVIEQLRDEKERLRVALGAAHAALNDCPFVDRLERQRAHEVALGALRSILGAPPYDDAGGSGEGANE